MGLSYQKRFSLLFFALQDGDFVLKKNRFLAQPSKKANCSARLKLREVVVFPAYKVNINITLGVTQCISTKEIRFS